MTQGQDDFESGAVLLVPEGAQFNGRVLFRGEASVGGRVTGPVEGPGRLVVLASAVLTGPVEVGELLCAGTIEGPVQVRQVARLASSARLRGPLRVPRLAVENGALIEGRCDVGELGPDRSEPR